MTCHATIVFSQSGVQPPVYVVTSLSEPPWETLEMQVEKKAAAASDLIFRRTFENVAEGTYQYKIRIGDGHWVVDESKETATDELGNCNNVIHVRPDSVVAHEQTPPRTVGSGHAPQDNDLKPGKEDKGQMSESQGVSDPPIPTIQVTNAKSHSGGNTAADDSIETSEPTTTKASYETPETSTTSGLDDGGGELDAAPLLRHESVQGSESGTKHMETIGEEFKEPSSDYSSTAEGSSTPTQTEVSGHETETNGDSPVLATTLDKEEELSESDQAPLLRGETESELDAPPLLPHETGFGDAKGSIATAKSVFTDEDIDDEEEEEEFDSHDIMNGKDIDHDEDEVPLLPHEQDAANGHAGHADHVDDFLLPHERGSVVSDSGCDRGDGSVRRQLSFENDNGSASGVFARGSFFRPRNNSSTLPHKLPRSDAEDEDLLDPSLERFPIDRELILERVATIGLHLPEDETIDNSHHSPAMSVFSQACSSVDLAPVKSYASLASVPEDDDSDNEEEAEVDSLPSPVLMNFSRSSAGFAQDPHKTPMPDDSKRFDLLGEHSDYSDKQESNSSEIQGVNDVAKNNEAKASNLGKLAETIASPSTILKPVIPSIIADDAGAPTDQHSEAIATDSPRRVSEANEVETKESDLRSPRKQTQVSDNKAARSVPSPTPHPLPYPHPNAPLRQDYKSNETFAHFIVRIVSEQTGIGAAIVVAGVAAAVWYFLGSS